MSRAGVGREALGTYIKAHVNRDRTALAAMNRELSLVELGRIAMFIENASVKAGHFYGAVCDRDLEKLKKIGNDLDDVERYFALAYLRYKSFYRAVLVEDYEMADYLLSLADEEQKTFMIGAQDNFVFRMSCARKGRQLEYLWDLVDAERQQDMLVVYNFRNLDVAYDFGCFEKVEFIFRKSNFKQKHHFLLKNNYRVFDPTNSDFYAELSEEGMLQVKSALEYVLDNCSSKDLAEGVERNGFKLREYYHRLGKHGVVSTRLSRVLEFFDEHYKTDIDPDTENLLITVLIYVQDDIEVIPENRVAVAKLYCEKLRYYFDDELDRPEYNNFMKKLVKSLVPAPSLVSTGDKQDEARPVEGNFTAILAERAAQNTADSSMHK